MLWLGAGALVFLGVFLEYQGLAYVEMAGAVALVGVVVSLAVLALGVSFLRGNGTRAVLLVGLAGGGLPFAIEGLMHVCRTEPNVHGLSFLGWLTYFFASEACAMLLLLGGAWRGRRG